MGYIKGHWSDNREKIPEKDLTCSLFPFRGKIIHTMDMDTLFLQFRQEHLFPAGGCLFEEREEI